MGEVCVRGLCLYKSKIKELQNMAKVKKLILALAMCFVLSGFAVAEPADNKAILKNNNFDVRKIDENIFVYALAENGNYE